MITIGYSFCKGNHSADPTYINTNNINKIQIDNCICEDIFASKDSSLDFINDNKKWNYSTLLYALFNENLLGGNVEFAIESITSIRIKTRIKGTYRWNTIFEIPIENAQDLSFERFFRYAQAKTEYEFAIIPVLNGSTEGNISITSTLSDFTGLYFCDNDSFIQGFLNYEYTQERNVGGTIVQTIGRKYPFYISNAEYNYDSGTVNVTFIRFDNENCEFDINNAWKYRKEITDFLTNHKPKIMKNEEGKMWLVCINGNLTETQNGHYHNVISNIEWTEIGNAQSSSDLYDNGLIDINVERYIWGKL